MPGGRAGSAAVRGVQARVRRRQAGPHPRGPTAAAPHLVGIALLRRTGWASRGAARSACESKKAWRFGRAWERGGGRYPCRRRHRRRRRRRARGGAAPAPAPTWTLASTSRRPAWRTPARGRAGRGAGQLGSRCRRAPARPPRRRRRWRRRAGPAPRAPDRNWFWSCAPGLTRPLKWPLAFCTCGGAGEAAAPAGRQAAPAEAATRGGGCLPPGAAGGAGPPRAAGRLSASGGGPRLARSLPPAWQKGAAGT